MNKRGFNLLRPQLSPPTSWDKIYQWMVGTARVIVIIVELIVVGAFATRVVVDTIGKNLDKKVTLKAAEINANKSTEDNFRDIQERTDLYRSLWEISSSMTPTYNFINSLISDYQGLLNIQITKSEVTISGELPGQNIDKLEVGLKDYLIGNTAGNTALFYEVLVSEVNSGNKSERENASFSIIAKLVQTDFPRTLITTEDGTTTQ
jgi:hypothetical protein